MLIALQVKFEGAWSLLAINATLEFNFNKDETLIKGLVE